MSVPAAAERVRFAPVGGPLITKGVVAVGLVAALGAAAILARFIFGLGAVTALNDGYPWGLWIAFDVVIGTALACGGYALALLIFILNRGQYHPMIRAAVLTSAFGYTIAGVSVVLDVGRYYTLWKVPLYFWHWNLNSVLLEVALCIMAYTVVLWLELAPAFLVRGARSSNERLRRFSVTVQPWLKRGLAFIIAIGILLPTMHQSSLGSLMLLAGPRLHPLWNTPLLPLLFLVSCIGMGYAAVVMESTISARALNRAPERRMLAGLGLVMVPVQVLYIALRVGDLAYRGQLGALFALDAYSIVALVELALFVAAPLLLVSERQRRDLGNLFRAAILLLLAGAMYRVDTFLVAFNPGPNWSYFPSVGEILITVGLVAIEILGYILIVRYFPILSGQSAPMRAPADYTERRVAVKPA
jgi:Ni/Fe-hydrogenase subunit HybB-like protein